MAAGQSQVPNTGYIGQDIGRVAPYPPTPSNTPFTGIGKASQPTKLPPPPNPSPTDILSQQIMAALQPAYGQVKGDIAQLSSDPFQSMLPGQVQSALSSTMPGVQQALGAQAQAGMTAAGGAPSANIIEELMSLLQGQARYGYNVFASPQFNYAGQGQGDQGIHELLGLIQPTLLPSTLTGGTPITGLFGTAANTPVVAPGGTGTTTLK